MVIGLLSYTSYYEKYLVLCVSRVVKAWEKLLLVHRKLMKWKVQSYSKTKLLAWEYINRVRTVQGNAL